MRLRIETCPPLARRKTWINASPGLFGLGTRRVEDLRRRLIRELELPIEIVLLFEGFELVGSDTLEGLLEKDDLVQYDLLRVD
jgi:hypothetical protein